MTNENKRRTFTEVPGYPGIWVSEDGTVLREARVYSTQSRYPKVTVNGVCKSIHRMVCEAFHGPPPSPLHQVAHNNGDPHDNRAENLRRATVAENSADKEAHGTAVKGAAHYASKLSDDDVRAIRRRAVEGESQRLLARVFGVAPPTINNIVHRRKWRHVS